MKPVSGARLARAVERCGWALLRINGTKPLKAGWQRHLMKIAGVTQADLS